jgi:hypothetical protein
MINMGDRWILQGRCKYCQQTNDIYYAPTSNMDTFTCEKCGKNNFICANLTIKKIEDATLDDIIEGFEIATNASWTDKQIKEMCKKRFKEIKGEFE